MIFYASGGVGHPLQQELMVRYEISILMSFAYRNVIKNQLPSLCARLRAEKKRLNFMLDSGAFTAWSSGHEILLGELIDECHRLQDEYSDCFDFVFVSLDRIAGRKGQTPTAKELADGAVESWHNFEIMQARIDGIVKPVYHIGDPEWFAKKCESLEYLGLGGGNAKSYEQRRTWAHDCGIRFKSQRLHGLAMTGTRMLRSVRWHSVDSASWVYWAGMGTIAWMLPGGKLKVIPVSKESPLNKKLDAHLSNYPPMHREMICEGLKEFGIPLDVIFTTQQARAAINLVIFKRACDWASNAEIVKELSMGVFDEPNDD